MSVDLRVDLGGIALRNPVLTASGTFGYGTEFAPFLDLGRLGGIVSKSLTLEPRTGNLPHRIAETHGGMLNAIGLENVGVDAFLGEKLPALAADVVVIASVFGTEIDQYAEASRRLSASPRVAGLEINASCPHVKSGGIEFGQNPKLLAELVRAVLAPAGSRDAGDDCVLAGTTGRGDRPLVLLAGHLDTVPLTVDPANLPTRRVTSGGVDTLWGRGTVDMKGGVAVLLRVARQNRSVEQPCRPR